MALNQIQPFNYGGGELAMGIAQGLNQMGDAFAGAIYRKNQEIKKRDQLKQKQIQEQLYKLDAADLFYKEFQTRKNKEIQNLEGLLEKAYTSKEKGLFKERITDEENIAIMSAIKKASERISDLGVTEKMIAQAKEEYNKNPDRWDTDHFASALSKTLESGHLTTNFLVPNGGNPLELAQNYNVLSPEQIKNREFKERDTNKKYHMKTGNAGATQQEQLFGYNALFNSSEPFRRGIINNILEDYEALPDNQKMALGDKAVNAFEQYKADKSRVPQELNDIAYRYGIEDMGLPGYINKGWEQSNYDPQLERIAVSRQREGRLAKGKDNAQLNLSIQDNVFGLNNKQGRAAVIDGGITLDNVPSSQLKELLPKDVSEDVFVNFRPKLIFEDGTVQATVTVPEHEKEISPEEYESMGIEKEKVRKAGTGEETPTVYEYKGEELSYEQLKERLSDENIEKIPVITENGKIVKIKTNTFGKIKDKEKHEVLDRPKKNKYYKTIPKQTYDVEADIGSVLSVLDNKTKMDLTNQLKINNFAVQQNTNQIDIGF